MALVLLSRALRGGETIVCDKGYAGQDFAGKVKDLGATILRPPRADEEGKGPHIAPIRQRIESVFLILPRALVLASTRPPLSFLRWIGLGDNPVAHSASEGTPRNSPGRQS